MAARPMAVISVAVLLVALGAAFSGCGSTDQEVGALFAPPPEAPFAPPVAGLPADWDAEVQVARAVDLNPDPGIVEVELEARVEMVEFVPGLLTRAYTYNGTVPGPVIEGRVGDRLIVHFTNRLPEETVVHWHGVHLPANMDGSHISQLAVNPGETFTYDFPLLTAGMFWYHPHVRTHEQLEKGLYGTLLVRDDVEDSVGLPADELILVLDDILLDAAGQVEPPFPAEPVERALAQLNGRVGNHWLVNGSAVPTITVHSGVPIRLRLLNTANTTFMRLSLAADHVWRIGADVGLLGAPVPVSPIEQVPDDLPFPPPAGWTRTTISDPDRGKGVLLTPGERMDMTWTPVGAPGEELYLEWHDTYRGRHDRAQTLPLHVPIPGGGMTLIGGDAADGRLPPQDLVRFVFTDTSNPNAAVRPQPTELRDLERIDTTGATTLPLTFGHTFPDATGETTFFVTRISGFGVPFSLLGPGDGVEAVVGGTYVWEVTNLTAGDHPFHVHGFSFQPIEVEYFDADTPGNNRVAPFPILENKDVLALPARPGAFMRSYTVTRMAMRFDDTGREGQVAASGKEPTSTTSGGWLVHCHILEHAAKGMMTFINLREP